MEISNNLLPNLATNPYDVAINGIWAVALLLCLASLCFCAYKIVKLYMNCTKDRMAKAHEIKLKELELKQREMELNKLRLDYNQDIKLKELSHKAKMDECEFELKKKIEGF